MKEQLSRRQFLQLSLGLGAALFASPGAAQEQEYSGLLSGRRGLAGDIRLLQFGPEKDFSVMKLNAQWREMYGNQEINTPSLIEGVATHYGMAATALKQLETKAEEYLQQENTSEEAARILELWNHFLDNNIYKQIETLGLSSTEFGVWFYEAFKKAGYDGVLATKSHSDFGFVYEIQVWDNRIKEWRGKTKEQNYTFIVLDMATGQTYWDKQYKKFETASLLSGNEPLSFGWFGDISTDFIQDQLQLDPSNQVLIIRGISEPFHDHSITWPRYREIPYEMSRRYIMLGKDVHQVLSTPNVSRFMYQVIQYQSNDFHMEVSGVERINEMNQGLWMASIFRSLNIPLIWEPVNLVEYAQWIAETTDRNQVGIPMGIFTQQRLYDAWKANGILTELRGNATVSLDKTEIPQGIFALVDMPGHYGDEQLVKIGFVLKIDDVPEFVWFDESEKRVKRLEINNKDDYQQLFTDDEGNILQNRVLKILS